MKNKWCKIKYRKKLNKFQLSSTDNEFITNSEKDTAVLAYNFANELHGGEVILLNGILGAGKTTFTKGIAQALGVKDIVTSPTFTIMKEYNGKFKICHFDMYRIETIDEINELGFNDLLYDEANICIIEWNKFDNLQDVITVDIEYIDKNKRKFVIKGIK